MCTSIYSDSVCTVHTVHALIDDIGLHKPSVGHHLTFAGAPTTNAPGREEVNNDGNWEWKVAHWKKFQLVILPTTPGYGQGKTVRPLFSNFWLTDLSTLGFPSGQREGGGGPERKFPLLHKYRFDVRQRLLPTPQARKTQLNE